MKKRDFDVVIFGASGFTGRLVAEYMQNQYGGGDLRWAMAGRSKDKLAAVRKEMGVSDDVPLIEADSSDPKSLTRMVETTRVVLTTVGPYQLYGRDLVKACANVGTDYVDLCGEPAWMYDMIEEFDEQARATGARIVHSCGFDSIPFDLGVFYTQQKAQQRWGEVCSHIRGRVRKMKGTFSGGTAASFMATMIRAGSEPEVMTRLKDPFSLVPNFSGPPQPTGHKPIYEEDLKSWSAPFIMASINTKNVHRSNALMSHPYGKDFIYDEMLLTGDGDAGKAMAETVAQSQAMSKNPPKPGEGPSRDERESGFYDVMFVGAGRDGSNIVTSVSGDKDPGYGSTSKMIAESAICLARDDLKTGGGVMTPAPAMGTALIERLEDKAGLIFKVEH